VTKVVTVFFGQDGGQSSSTSMTEALLVGCWSSTPLESQVVRPRPSSGSQGPDLDAEHERSSTMRSGLGRDAWSSPTVGGRDTLGLDCFSYLLVRVFFVNWKAPSSNTRFCRVRDVKGFSCKMYLPCVSI
jgi:hypothetical protein